MGQGRTDVDAGAAGNAPLLVPAKTRAGKLQGLCWTAGQAKAAARALLGQGQNADPLIQSLRIMTPPTAERTAFEENGRSDVRTIVQRVPFDGKYCCVQRTHFNS
jgi:hypothetical protein